MGVTDTPLARYVRDHLAWCRDTASGLARRADVCPSTVRAILAGRPARRATVARLAAAMRVPAEVLYAAAAEDGR